ARATCGNPRRTTRECAGRHHRRAGRASRSTARPTRAPTQDRPTGTRAEAPARAFGTARGWGEEAEAGRQPYESPFKTVPGVRTDQAERRFVSFEALWQVGTALSADGKRPARLVGKC